MSRWLLLVSSLILAIVMLVGPRLLDARSDAAVGTAAWADEIATMTLCDAMNNPRVPRFVAATADRTQCTTDPTTPLTLCDAIHRPDGTPRTTTNGPSDPTLLTACEPTRSAALPAVGTAAWADEIATMTLCDAMNNPRVPRFVAATADRNQCTTDPTTPLSLCDAIHRPDGTPRTTTNGPSDPTLLTACEPAGS